MQFIQRRLGRPRNPENLSDFLANPEGVNECALCLLPTHQHCLAYCLSELDIVEPPAGLVLPDIFHAAGALCAACKLLSFAGAPPRSP